MERQVGGSPNWQHPGILLRRVPGSNVNRDPCRTSVCSFVVSESFSAPNLANLREPLSAHVDSSRAIAAELSATHFVSMFTRARGSWWSQIGTAACTLRFVIEGNCTSGAASGQEDRKLLARPRSPVGCALRQWLRHRHTDRHQSTN